MKLLSLIGGISLTLCSLNIYAASIDGSIVTGNGEYQWSTEGAEGNAKWNTHGGTKEYNDASGGDRWDINYLGTNVQNGKFQFGAVGGQILSGQQTGTNIYLGDFAISVGGHTNPTLDSSGFEYAIRLLGVNGNTGEATFSLLGGGTWEGADLYNNAYTPDHITETYKMIGGTELTTFSGQWSNNGGDDNVLEGEFDLSFLTLFNSSLGGSIATYLTMTCVNDEAMVLAHVAPVPVPGVVWLFGSVVLGLTGLKRRVKA
jgi:hypothetical protein